jgi:hypothetical protein
MNIAADKGPYATLARVSLAKFAGRLEGTAPSVPWFVVLDA